MAVCSSKSCTRCAIGCGVHGFAMNPCDSSPFSTAPYYREARVTLPQRQTACRMWHCCARRIDRFLGRRKLGCTPTRWAERHPQGVYRIRKAAKPPTAAQQRIIGESQIVYQPQTRQRRAMGSAVGKHCSSSSCLLAMSKPFSWGSKGDILFCEREYPL